MKRKAEPARCRNGEEFAAKLVERWPELAVKPGHEEIENPESELFKIRERCVLTASRAGVLWNCTSGPSPKRFVDEKLGRVQPAPFSDYAKFFMERGRIMEPQIANRATMLMWAEFRQLFGGPFEHRSPGPFCTSKTAATPDGLWQFKIADTWYVMPFEIKFFASKNIMPTAFPDHYIAQVVMQMIHARCEISIAIGCVEEPSGRTPLRFWMLRLTESVRQDYEKRLKRLKNWITRKANVPNQPREGEMLRSVVVGTTSDITTLWDFIDSNRHRLVRIADDEDTLTLGY